MRQILRPGFAGLLMCAVAVLSGCSGGGGPHVRLSGTILKNGTALKVNPGDMLVLTFQGATGSGEAATVNPDGSFTVDGLGKKGIPPGKYTVRISITSGGSDPASLAHMKQANQQFAALSGKEFEVGSEPDQKITLDVTKGTISK